MNIKEKYQKAQKKKKVLTILKWVAFGTGWTFLLACFVGLVVLGCKGSADKRTKQTTQSRVIGDYTLNAMSYEGTYNNELLYDGTALNMSVSGLNYLDEALQGQDYSSGWSGNYLTIEGNPRKVRFVIQANRETNWYDIAFYLGAPSHPETHNELFATFSLDSGNDTLAHCDYMNSKYDNFIYSTTNTLFTSWESAFEEYEYDEPYLWWGLLLGSNSTPLTQVQTTEVIFENQINRYAPLGASNDLALYVGDSYLHGEYFIKTKIFDGLFRDLANNYYKGIYVHYIQGQGLRYIDSSGNAVVMQTPSMQYQGLYYEDMDGNLIYVNKPVWATVNNNVCYTNKSTWVNPLYQHIFILTTNNIVTGLPVRNMAVISALNNDNGTGTGTGGSGGSSNGLLDCFALITMALSSCASIFSIQLLPGITIGTLMFVPFVILIIVAVVWLFKR